MIRKALSTLAMCFAPLLYVAVIEPIDFSAPTTFNEYYDAGSAGYSYRWTSDDTTAFIECQVYELCLWVDVKGPECSDELHVAVSFFDSNDNWMTDSRVVIPGEGRSQFDTLEIGSFLNMNFGFYMVDEVWCSAGLPTAMAEA